MASKLRGPAVVAAAASVTAFVFSYGPGPGRMTLGGSLAIAAASAVAVGLSGARPRAALASVVALVVLLPATGSTFEALDLVIVLVLFQVAVRSSVRPAVIAAVGLVSLETNDIWQRIVGDQPFAVPSVAYPVLLTALATGLGVQSRRVLQQHARLLELHDAERQRAASDERRRIARDLHDVAAHHLTALVVRNQLARRVGTPAAFETAAEFTATTAAQALDAMRSVVHVLHNDDGSSRAPQPRLADLAGTFAVVGEAGLRVHGAPPAELVVSLEAEVALVLIAREALANVLRHRGPGDCWFELSTAAGSVELTIDDDGPVAAPVAGVGYGIAGMRARAETCGGRLEVGPSPRGGWRVAARVPVRS